MLWNTLKRFQNKCLYNILYHSNLKIITLIWLFGSRGIKYGSKLVRKKIWPHVTFLTRFVRAKNVTWAKYLPSVPVSKCTIITLLFFKRWCVKWNFRSVKFKIVCEVKSHAWSHAWSTLHARKCHLAHQLYAYNCKKYCMQLGLEYVTH